MLDKIHTNPTPTVKRAMEGILRTVLEKRPEISFAYIHGSFARGEDFRDIDVAVYLKVPSDSPLRYELTLEAELMEAVGKYLVDVRVLNGAPVSFAYHVFKDGNVLIARDDDERSDFQEAVLARYFDFAPYRAEYLKETLGRAV
jgi:predicted nucleotidyltransferase